jgi:hypothetical protein
MTSSAERTAGDMLYLPRVPAAAGKTRLQQWHRHVSIHSRVQYKGTWDLLVAIKLLLEPLVLAMTIVGL